MLHLSLSLSSSALLLPLSAFTNKNHSIQSAMFHGSEAIDGSICHRLLIHFHPIRVIKTTSSQRHTKDASMPFKCWYGLSLTDTVLKLSTIKSNNIVALLLKMLTVTFLCRSCSQPDKRIRLYLIILLCFFIIHSAAVLRNAYSVSMVNVVSLKIIILSEIKQRNE